jgi:pimeloyl-ACP methyl ester carboxylesterase
VVLLHGLGGNLAHWAPVSALLRQRYRLIAIDLPSHGASTAPDVHSFDHDLGAVDEVRQRLGLHRPAVIGHSYGGMLAVALGTHRPDVYRVAVNIDGLRFALAPERDREPHPEQWPVAGAVDQGDAEWLAVQVRREVEEAAAIGLHLDTHGEMVRRAFQLGDDGLWHSSPTLGRFVEIERALDVLDLVPAYAASTCRTVTVIADRQYAETAEEEVAARRHVDRVRAALAASGSELETIASGHYAHVEVPDVVAGRFKHWVGG